MPLCETGWINSAPKRHAVLISLLAVCCARVSLADAQPETTAEPARGLVFEGDVVPILKAYCWKCHGGEARKAKLDLRTFPLMLKGGGNGAVLQRGSAEKSLLFQKLASKTMPPAGELKPTDTHVATIRRWIDAGALARYEGGPLTEEQSPPLTTADRKWWSFKKPVRPAVPQVKHHDRVRTPIDAFVLQKLEAKGLNFSADADRVTLIRRVYFDSIGLPPMPDEIDEFLADNAQNAFERLVDRLLASPHYGERWGRHWLDAAGYVDTIGTDNDANIINEREGIWKYRDYVVRSFNGDKPYDRFLIEQISGDELVDWRNAKAFTPQIKESLIATGFLRLAADVTYAPELNTADIRNQVLYNTLQILGSNLLGLTLQCAQCHSHKFDPISHADYYRLRAVFAPAYDVQNWKQSKERFLYDVSTAEKRQIDAHNANVERQVAALKQQITEIRQPVKQKLFDEKLAQLPEPVRADAKLAVNTPEKKRSAIQESLAKKFGPLLKVNPGEIDKTLDAPAKQKINALQQQIGGVQSTKRSYGKIQALWDVGPASPAYLHRRGNYQTPGPQVSPGVLSVLDEARQPFALPGNNSNRSTSGYRTEFARRLTRPDHPLTARVIVNRVWQQYFGKGIVTTSANFGLHGALPTHPELLDWLATEFINGDTPALPVSKGMTGGWSLKRLHRLILTSTVYRQSSHRPNDASGTDKADGNRRGPNIIDPENRLLWRMSLRRLESEIIRDAVLAVSGRMETCMGGPPVPLKPNPDSSVEIDTAKLRHPHDQDRRSLYLFARRNYQLTELSVFDQPVVATNCTQRTDSAVVSQPLAMLNGKFLFEQAGHFAVRVRAIAGADESSRIESAFRLAFARKPSAEEVTLSRELLHEQAKRYREQKTIPDEQSADAALVDLCQMLLNTNEFLYIE